VTLKAGAGLWIVGDILEVDKEKAVRASKEVHLIYISYALMATESAGRGVAPYATRFFGPIWTYFQKASQDPF
jgi:hypothetical protein